MAFWSNLLSTFRGGTNVFTPNVTHFGPGEVASLLDPSRMTAVQMWETQPHFRTVVSFLARNIAQLGLHAFVRDGEDRLRDRDSVLARALDDVDGQMTTYDLVFALVGDLALYDRAYWLVTQTSETSSGWLIRRLPPTWVEPVMANPWDVKHYRVYMKSNGAAVTVSPDKVLRFSGYHPGVASGASPTVEALRETLQEQVEASKYRSQVWKRGGRVSSILERPAGAPPWSDAAREAFREDWYAKYTGNGSKAGGTPLLEDGMTLKRIDFSAQDQQFVEAAKLSLVTVAAAFHVNPTMIGQNDGANYSNVREFRKMLYGDTLGPLVAQIEARINRFLVPLLGMDRARHYVEFNIEEKLQGNFEEQTQALQSAVGRPWMTADEARAIRNMPALGGDAAALVTPLNVLVGGQASARDSGSQNRTGAASRPGFGVKEPAPVSFEVQAARVFSKFFARQARAVKGQLGVKAPEWWDYERWNNELADDLYRFAVEASKAVAADVLDGIGFSPDEYDVDRTFAFLRVLSERVAGQVNLATFGQLEAALDDDDPDEAVSRVFEVAETSRAEQSGTTLTTAVAAFATVEAGKQVAGSRARKRWIVNSGNPRASHAAMDGEEVPVDEPFSNGLMWPGSFDSDVEEVAGCQCSIEIFVAD